MRTERRHRSMNERPLAVNSPGQQRGISRFGDWSKLTSPLLDGSA